MNTTEPGTIDEIMETELREELEATKRRLSAALAALEIIESFYKAMSEKDRLIPVGDIPGYYHLRDTAME